MSLRDRIAKLERAVAPPEPHYPYVIVCHHVGDDEDRPPGVYYDDGPGSGSPTIVYEGAEPPEEVLAQFCHPRGAHRLLVIICDPDEVPPPIDEPGGSNDEE